MLLKWTVLGLGSPPGILNTLDRWKLASHSEHPRIDFLDVVISRGPPAERVYGQAAKSHGITAMAVKRKLLVTFVVFAIVAGGAYVLKPRWEKPASFETFRSAEQTEWKEVLFKAGSFKILMPGTAKRREQRFSPAPGQDFHVMGLESKQGVWPVEFFVFSYEIRSAENESLLEQLRGGVLEGSKGKLIETRKMQLKTHVGEEFVFEATDQRGTRTQKSRHFIINNRYFFVSVVTPKDLAAANYVDKFLDSFQVLEA